MSKRKKYSSGKKSDVLWCTIWLLKSSFLRFPFGPSWLSSFSFFQDFSNFFFRQWLVLPIQHGLDCTNQKLRSLSRTLRKFWAVDLVLIRSTGRWTSKSTTWRKFGILEWSRFQARVRNSVARNWRRYQWWRFLRDAAISLSWKRVSINQAGITSSWI